MVTRRSIAVQQRTGPPPAKPAPSAVVARRHTLSASTKPSVANTAKREDVKITPNSTQTTKKVVFISFCLLKSFQGDEKFTASTRIPTAPARLSTPLKYVL